MTAGSVYDTNICQIERTIATTSKQPYMMGEIVANMLCITWDPAAVPEGGFLVVSSPAAFAKAVGKEPAGAPFHDYAMRQAGLIVDSDEETDSATEDAPSARGPALDEQTPEGVSWKGKKNKKQKRAKDKHDYYKLLGLENERWMATEAQINKAYKRKALECHPDKAMAVLEESERERVEAHFLLVQEAQEHLSDPVKRREFDSIDEFDDSLPESCAAEDYFKVFGPAFRRQSRWSVVQPVPDLADDEAEAGVVDKFYNFWFYNYKSWREFPHPDEEDVDQAEGREHKRWIDRFNSKLREKAKKEETRRMKAFVEAAFSIDPRMVRRRAEDKAAKERRKHEKYAGKRQAQEEAEKKAADEAAAAAAAAIATAAATADNKKARQAERKQMQTERKRLRAIVSTPLDGGEVLWPDYELEQLCAKLTLMELQSLCKGLYAEGASRPDQTAVLQDYEERINSSTEAERAAKEAATRAAAAEADKAKAAEAEARVAKAASWEPEELRLLEKAIVKFPVGTAKRWEQVAAYVRTRTMDDVIEMAKHGLAARAPVNDSFSILKKHQGNIVINSDATARNEVFTDVQVNLSGAAVLQEGAPVNGSASNGDSAAAGPEATANGTASAAPPANGADWGEEQQLALVAAMKKFGKDTPDRWDRIAEVVPGKGKADCFKRFKALRDSVRANKATK